MNVGSICVLNVSYVDSDNALLLAELWHSRLCAGQTSVREMILTCRMWQRSACLGGGRLFSSVRVPWQQILGVNSTASVEEITAAFKTKAMEVHPDTTTKELGEAEEAFKLLVQAKENALEAVSGTGERPITTTQPGWRRGARAPGAPPPRDQAANLAYMMSRKEEIFAGIQKAREQDASDIQSQVNRWQAMNPDLDAREQWSQREYGPGYRETVRVTSRCDHETNGVEVQTVEISMETPEGAVEGLVREQWKKNGQANQTWASIHSTPHLHLLDCNPSILNLPTLR